MQIIKITNDMYALFWGYSSEETRVTKQAYQIYSNFYGWIATVDITYRKQDDLRLYLNIAETMSNEIVRIKRAINKAEQQFINKKIEWVVTKLDNCTGEHRHYAYSMFTPSKELKLQLIDGTKAVNVTGL